MELKKLIVVVILMLMTGTSLQAQGSDTLIGEWTIDLRPTPDAEGYYQVFQVGEIDGNTFTGTFYGSQVENGLINNSWDRIYLAFTTRDSSHAYYHSGYLDGTTLHGISYCPGREFTAPWTGVKK